MEGGLTSHGLTYRYEVRHLADEDPEPFLADHRLLPFAPLAKLSRRDRPRMLARVLDEIARLPDPTLRELLGRVTIDLAAIRLDRVTITTTWEESAMPIPSLLDTIYQEGRHEGRQEGRHEGRQEGRHEGRQEGREEGRTEGCRRGWEQAASALLRHRFGDDPRIPGLARDLAPLGPDEYLARIEAATSLDDLAAG